MARRPTTKEPISQIPSTRYPASDSHRPGAAGHGHLSRFLALFWGMATAHGRFGVGRTSPTGMAALIDFRSRAAVVLLSTVKRDDCCLLTTSMVPRGPDSLSPRPVLVRSPPKHLSSAPSLLRRRLRRISRDRRRNGGPENICICDQSYKSEALEKCFRLQTCRIGAEKKCFGPQTRKNAAEKNVFAFSATKLSPPTFVFTISGAKAGSAGFGAAPRVMPALCSGTRE